MFKRVTVTTPSRIHMGLLDCGDTTQRLFGGIGFAINAFPTIVEVTSAREWAVDSLRSIAPSERLEYDVKQLMGRLKAESFRPCSIKIQESTPEHLGLGSKTSLLMSIAYGVAIVNDYAQDKEKIVGLVRRGGTSGIGVNTFRYGGLVADGGHRETRGERNFEPSSRRIPKAIPPVVSRVRVPAAFRVCLFYSQNGSRIEGRDEVIAFQEAAPMSDDENLRALAAAYHGVIPAILEDDIVALAEAVKDLNNHGMKKFEVSLQDKNTRDFLAEAWGENIAAGLSSFGPVVYCITRKDLKEMAWVKRQAKKHQLNYLGTFSFNNTGAKTIKL